MSSVTPFPDLDAAREEASAWIARTFRGLTPEETAQLQVWIARPVNRRAMLEMQSVWEGLDVLSVLAAPFPKVPAAPAQILPKRPKLVAAAAVAALAIGVGVWLSVSGLRSPASVDAQAPIEAQAYASAIGEHRTIPLSDGSVLALNSNTLVEVAYTSRLRSLTLHRGEAHFEVAHNAARPFIVDVGGRFVNAIGTAFNIRRRDDSAVDVLVTEGIVSTYRSVDDDAQAARLAAGQLLRVLPDGSEQVTTLDAAQRDSLLAWRRGVLVLDGITLEAAMAEMSRYTRQKIVIADPALRTIHLGGSFPVDDLGKLMDALQAGFGIEAHEDKDGTLRLSRAAKP
jgi:transmembrane sensor